VCVHIYIYIYGELLGHMVIHTFIKELPAYFSKWLQYFCSPTRQHYNGSNFWTTFVTVFFFFYVVCHNECEMTSHDRCAFLKCNIQRSYTRNQHICSSKAEFLQSTFLCTCANELLSLLSK
jgi:hypothetical protein